MKKIIFFFPFCSSLEEDANFFCFVVAGIDWNRTVIYASFQWSTREEKEEKEERGKEEKKEKKRGKR